MPRSALVIAAATAVALVAASPLAAQLQTPLGRAGLPPVPGAVGDILDRTGDVLGDLGTMAERQASRLLQLRDQNLSRLLRQNRDRVERDIDGHLARRGEILLTGSSADELAALQSNGFSVLAEERVEGLDLRITRLRLPDGMSLAKAEALARKLAPGADIGADNLHWQAGALQVQGRNFPFPALMAAPGAAAVETPIGMIDGAPGPSISGVSRKGFAEGAPLASDHGSAIASLLRGQGAQRLWVADVYGSDAAGGNALAVVRGLGWLVASGCKVVSISLVGPRNQVLERAIERAQQRGVVIVAAVGNDGPAAPPGYPASYDKVVSVTGVDRKGRALIEAGRALHLDYAAPGADVHALNAKGKSIRLRGTSFATPLVAARLAAALAAGGSWQARLDREARDLGPKGPDRTYGRGLLCEGCAARP